MGKPGPRSVARSSWAACALPCLRSSTLDGLLVPVCGSSLDARRRRDPAAQSQQRLATRAPGVRTLVAAAAERSTIELPTGLSMEYFEAQPAAGRSQNLGPAATPSR